MTFTITLHGDDSHQRIINMFTTAHHIEHMGCIEGAHEYRVTYCLATIPCPNECQCQSFTMTPEAAAALVKAFEPNIDGIMSTIFHNRDHYAFRKWGMYVGVEYDGYIHT